MCICLQSCRFHRKQTPDKLLVEDERSIPVPGFMQQLTLWAAMWLPRRQRLYGSQPAGETRWRTHSQAISLEGIFSTISSQAERRLCTSLQEQILWCLRFHPSQDLNLNTECWRSCKRFEQLDLRYSSSFSPVCVESPVRLYGLVSGTSSTMPRLNSIRLAHVS